MNGTFSDARHPLDHFRHKQRVLFALDHARPGDQKKIAGANVDAFDVERNAHCDLKMKSMLIGYGGLWISPHPSKPPPSALLSIDRLWPGYIVIALPPACCPSSNRRFSVKTSVPVQKVEDCAASALRPPEPKFSRACLPCPPQVLRRNRRTDSGRLDRGAIGGLRSSDPRAPQARADTTYGRARALQAYTIRRNAALVELELPRSFTTQRRRTRVYRNRIGNYSKGASPTTDGRS